MTLSGAPSETKVERPGSASTSSSVYGAPASASASSTLDLGSGAAAGTSAVVIGITAGRLGFGLRAESWIVGARVYLLC